MDVSRLFNQVLRWTVHLETDMLSIQRLLMICRLEPEVGGTYKPQPTNVDHLGHLEFNQVSMSYKKDLKPALQNVSFTLEPGEQIAVVGRTGAGKSSLF
jgi:ABC-type multidrug transport system fused ATPase/permease subunit